jgi:hypothetical protein
MFKTFVEKDKMPSKNVTVTIDNPVFWIVYAVTQ